VRSLTVEDYDELVAWLQDEAARVRGGEDSIDMDALMRQRSGGGGED
jgi:hypothetical protein